MLISENYLTYAWFKLFYKNEAFLKKSNYIWIITFKYKQL